ncbi:hypothetical protein [Paraburkholderia diazotrophica]|uniref:hypothetical protein n=1 Tax=Paraburkholderia diazotrophica TaxID=667676 RepID=UPI00115FA008|nr:hypothetical protein [Paraburkholderia diazotrophica]
MIVGSYLQDFGLGVQPRAERFFIFSVIDLCAIRRINLVTEKPSVKSELSVMKVRFILEVGFSDSCFQGLSLSRVYLAAVKMRVAYFSISNPSVHRQDAMNEVRQALRLRASAVFVRLLPNGRFEISENIR